MPPPIAIIGGGISGLAAAFELQLLGVPFVLLERAPQCGGVVRTDHIDGYTIDAGPDALLTQKPAAIDLCRDLGVDGRLRSQTSRATFVARNGSLQELPEASVLGIPTRWRPFVTTNAFSWHGKLRMAAEMAIPRGGRDDESIASFIGRRFGREAVDYLAEPLLAGIHGGDPARLSMRSAFPRFLELEARYGSVIAGLRHLRVRPSAANGRPASPFVALPGGMSELTAALVQRLPPECVRTQIAVEEISETPRGYALKLSGREPLEAPVVIMATPPAVTAQLVRRVDSDFADLCGRIRAASVVTVALGYRRSAVRHPLNGTGLVVPRREGLTIRALSWVSSKWAGRAPAGRALLRAYLGGTQDPDAIERSDGELIAAACRDTSTLVNTVEDPELARVYRWREATPQLEVGHGDLMWKIEHRLNLRPNLLLSASGFRGTGIADCVADARQQARRAAERIRAAGEIAEKTGSAA